MSLTAFEKISAILLMLCFIWLIARQNSTNVKLIKVYQSGKFIMMILRIPLSLDGIMICLDWIIAGIVTGVAVIFIKALSDF